MGCHSFKLGYLSKIQKCYRTTSADHGPFLEKVKLTKKPNKWTGVNELNKGI